MRYGGGNRAKKIKGLETFTEYEFQVLAYSSVGDGPKSSIKVERTKEDGKNLLTDILKTSIPLIVVEWTKMIRCLNAQRFKKFMYI